LLLLESKLWDFLWKELSAAGIVQLAKLFKREDGSTSSLFSS